MLNDADCFILLLFFLFVTSLSNPIIPIDAVVVDLILKSTYVTKSKIEATVEFRNGSKRAVQYFSSSLYPIRGSEQDGPRPCLVVSPNSETGLYRTHPVGC